MTIRRHSRNQPAKYFLIFARAGREKSGRRADAVNPASDARADTAEKPGRAAAERVRAGRQGSDAADTA